MRQGQPVYQFPAFRTLLQWIYGRAGKTLPHGIKNTYDEQKRSCC